MDTFLKMGSPEWQKYMDKLIRKWSGWDSLSQMCKGSPTLRVSKHCSDDEAEAIRQMRSAYKFVTGKEPYPKSDWDMKSNRNRRSI